ncbi:MAG: hypothetical protein QM477_03070 [Planctomycetota bacterium]
MKRFLSCLCLAQAAVSCVLPEQTASSDIPGHALLEKQELHQLPIRKGGAAVQIDTNADGLFNQTLHLFIAEDGASVVSRYLGPGGPSSVNIHLSQEQTGCWHYLQCRVSGSHYAVALARWKLDSNGQVSQTYVRHTPMAEWRVLPGDQSDPYPLGNRKTQWRPWVDGKGVGDWRP